jgi:hypothetical protein
LFQKNTYQKLIQFTKIALILILTTFVFYKLVFAYHYDNLFAQFELREHLGSPFLLIATLLLVVFNWGIESIKWRILINRFEPISLDTAIKAVLSGVTLSIITPNQLGDFAGRVIHLEVLNKIKGTLVTVIGHTAQVLVTLFFGFFALAYFSSHFYHQEFWIPFAAVLLPILVFLYINLTGLYNWMNRFSWVRKFEKYIEVFGAYSKVELTKILALSIFRYLVFLFQYYLLLKYFQVHIDFIPAMACIVATFCVQSMVPSFLLLEIGLRGASALAFFTLFSVQPENILLAAYSLWIINMLLPALFGMYFIYRVKS